MSYALNVDSDAATALAQLPFDAQEDAWDLFEQLARDPRSPAEPQGRTRDVHVFQHVADQQVSRVLFAVVVDDAARIVFIPIIQPI